MERTDILELMSALKLYGMRAAYDEVMTTGIKRRHQPPRIIGDLLSAEIAEKQARSIKYQLTIAKLPLAKDLDDFDFTDTPINQTLIRDLASEVAFTPSSTSSTGWRAKPAPADKDGSPIISLAWTSSFSTSSATYPSRRPAVSCSFI
jgi:hypothetical protein